jgi:hypothetical protein
MKHLLFGFFMFFLVFITTVGCGEAYDPKPIPDDMDSGMTSDADFDCIKAYDPCGPAAEPPVCAMEVSIFYNAYGRCIQTEDGLVCMMTDRVVVCDKGCNTVSGRCFE